MLKTVVLSVLCLIVGVFLVNYVILPFASDLLNRPDIESWTGLGAGLRMLGIVLIGVLYVATMVRIAKSGQDDG